jgi:hypothetical protein
MANPATRTSIRTARTPTRDTLDEIQKRSRQAKEADAAAHRPLHTANDQAEHARRLVNIADAKLLEFDREKAQAIGQSWPPRSPSPKEREERRILAEDLSAAERTLRVIEAKVEAARVPAEQAAAVVAEIEAGFDVAIMAVVSEEAQLAFAHLLEARRKAVEAEGFVRSIALAMASRRWFRAAEQVSMSLYELPRPEPQVNTASYLQLIERLKSDPDATVEV